MKEQPLVSIISPCYNGETYLKPFLDSLLTQTYNNVEFIFVNDGSTDKTEDIFMQYKPLLEKKGWNVIYHKQENGGAARAINYGLKIFTGKYLTWPDSDDILYPNYLQRKVEFMEDNSDCALLFNRVGVCVENNRNTIINTIEVKKPENYENIFDKFILGKEVIFCPISSFVRSKIFLQVFPSRRIYDESKGGQNWQLLLPMAYSQKIYYLDEVLACYVERTNSHSHIKTDTIKKLNQHEDLLNHTIESINMPEKEKYYYLKLIKNIYIKKRLKARCKNLLIKIFGEKIFNKVKGIVK